MKTQAIRSAGPVVERFSASAGRWLGVAACVMGGVLVVGAMFDDPGRNWRMISYGLALALLSWAVMVRPQVAAHEHGLLMLNVLRDVCVPWPSIERCKALQTLQVVTPEGVFHGLGLSKSARSMMRERVGGRSVIGTLLGSRGGPVSEPTGRAKEEVLSGVSYTDFVESRIRNLAESSRGQQKPVVTSPAPLPIAALAGAVLLAVLPLVV